MLVGDRFCEGCGADLRVRRSGSTSSEPEQRCHGCGHVPGPDSDDEGFCPDCGLRYRGGSDRVEIDLDVLAGVSDRGHSHPHNEDAIALGCYADAGTDPRIAAVVCDGVSSSRAPERASQAAAEAALDVLLDNSETAAGSAEQRVRAAVAAGARAVTAATPDARPDDASCTIVAAVVDPSDPARPEIAVAWIGDSRAYWLAAPDAPEPSRRLTTDHSWAAQVADSTGEEPPEAPSGPFAHVLTRWVGPDGADEPDVTLLRPAGPGILLLCSDGLWNYLPSATDLASAALAVTGSEPGLALRQALALTTLALDAGGHDNVTVAVIPITPRSST
ncbi:PP2C family serine/threonine-protein phosphatase [Pseudonocardia acaciae]|uniref:PP2C family serine/threonine-protein phosphatase n=1 Tax=Pseudonocardia acaciae TaxID=551276 RepID=UPI000686673C|nr:PP2C family serine/threonine-protein phosphatase [Pseudonocardia acaciae]